MFIFSTPVLIRLLWQLKTVVFPALVSNMHFSIVEIMVRLIRKYLTRLERFEKCEHSRLFGIFISDLTILLTPSSSFAKILANKVDPIQGILTKVEGSVQLTS